MSRLFLGRITPGKTALFICDMQEKFSKNIKYFPQIVTNTRKVLEGAKIMNIPVLYTEQYPKGFNSQLFSIYNLNLILKWIDLAGLGRTVPELDITNFSSAPCFEKVQFSMMVPELQNHLKTKFPEVV